MDGLVELFAETVINAGIIDAAKATELRQQCGGSPDIIEFAEAILEKFPDQFELIQGLIDDTADAYTKGDRVKMDPFAPPAAVEEPRAKIKLDVVKKKKTTVEEPPKDLPKQKPPQAPPQQSPEPTPEEDNTLDRGNRPPETVVPSGGAVAGIPEFTALDAANKPQIASALIGILLFLGENDFSDLHISGGSRPYGRKFGEVMYLAEERIERELAEAFALALLSPLQRTYFEKFKDYDFAIALDDGRRYRTNLMMHRDGYKVTFRLVPREIKSLEALGFGAHTKTIEGLLAYHNGLILVTGPVGCGKTTTLAAMVDALNRSRTDHIICVEDPIEIVHRSNQCSVTQRAVGPHTKSFSSALKGALRQDPDIIVIGEMRDLETIEMAISASETGHLVIGTMHTSDAAMTLNRLLDVFPPSAQAQIRAMVAESLRGVVCQRLLPGADGNPVVATEILVKNMAVSALIRDGKQAGLSNIIETGKQQGMILMDTSIMSLYQNGEITAETARNNIQNDIVRRTIT